jgi:hypothetical protein
MSSLATQQQQLAAAITKVGAGGTAALEPLLCKTPQGGAPRIDIYRIAFRARLAAALQENFPILHRVLGDESFRELADAFITARPSREPSIRWFGAELAGFLERHAELVPHPALIDLTRMEWALGTAFDAADASSITAADLLAVSPADWPALGFQPHPSVRLLSLAWAVEPLWSVLSLDENATTEPPTAHDHHLLIWRGAAQTQWRSVTPFEAKILAACMAGQPFATLCELAAAELGEQAAAEVASHLRAWVEAGLFAAIFSKVSAA